MRRGFTVIEMLFAILMLALISAFAIPAIINQVSDKKEEINNTSLDMIYSATILYMDDYEIASEKFAGDTYCVSLDKLVKEGYLTTPLKDYTTGDNIPLTKYVKTTINNNLEYDDFELTDTSC